MIIAFFSFRFPSILLFVVGVVSRVCAAGCFDVPSLFRYPFFFVCVRGGGGEVLHLLLPVVRRRDGFDSPLAFFSDCFFFPALPFLYIDSANTRKTKKKWQAKKKKICSKKCAEVTKIESLSIHGDIGGGVRVDAWFIDARKGSERKKKKYKRKKRQQDEHTGEYSYIYLSINLSIYISIDIYRYIDEDHDGARGLLCSSMHSHRLTFEKQNQAGRRVAKKKKELSKNVDGQSISYRIEGEVPHLSTFLFTAYHHVQDKRSRSTHLTRASERERERKKRGAKPRKKHTFPCCILLGSIHAAVQHSVVIVANSIRKRDSFVSECLMEALMERYRR